MNKPTNGDVFLYRIVLIVLLGIFVVYNVVIYQHTDSTNNNIALSSSAKRGSVLYQKNNCTACHQFYGLGGYLGPDLTNCVSNPKRGPEYIKAMLNSGVKSMPLFHFTENEANDILAFLTHVDSTGFYPNPLPAEGFAGWVELKYKKHRTK